MSPVASEQLRWDSGNSRGKPTRSTAQREVSHRVWRLLPCTCPSIMPHGASVGPLLKKLTLVWARFVQWECAHGSDTPCTFHAFVEAWGHSVSVFRSGHQARLPRLRWGIELKEGSQERPEVKVGAEWTLPFVQQFSGEPDIVNQQHPMLPGCDWIPAFFDEECQADIASGVMLEQEKNSDQ